MSANQAWSQFLTAVVFALQLAVSTIANAAVDTHLNIRPGDILIQRAGDGAWRTVRILEVDEAPDGGSVAHCLSYEPSKTKPTMVALAQLPVRIGHAPILASSFASGWERLGNQPVSEDELQGFVEYLKHTNFPRYLRLTGQVGKKLVAKASEHYKLANSLGEQGKRNEAIAEYTAAVDLFPLFYEAIDNRAFTYMELGKYEDALQDFELSLQVNPEGVHAFFSKGECLMKLGRLREAEAIFEQGVARFPEQRDLFSKFLQQVRGMKR
jgi:tetratricopeptide (TPR) repeat protein